MRARTGVAAMGVLVALLSACGSDNATSAVGTTRPASTIASNTPSHPTTPSHRA